MLLGRGRRGRAPEKCAGGLGLCSRALLSLRAFSRNCCSNRSPALSMQHQGGYAMLMWCKHSTGETCVASQSKRHHCLACQR